MSSLDLTREWLHTVLRPYSARERLLPEVMDILASRRSLAVKTDAFTFDSGQTALLLLLHGTLPISFRGATYQIPIHVWVPHEYPRAPPLVFVVPTKEMGVRKGREVEPGGRVREEVVEGWWRGWEPKTIETLLKHLTGIFSATPPVYSRPPEAFSSPSRPTASPQPTSSASPAASRNGWTDGGGGGPSSRPPPPPARPGQAPQPPQPDFLPQYASSPTPPPHPYAHVSHGRQASGSYPAHSASPPQDASPPIPNRPYSGVPPRQGSLPPGSPLGPVMPERPYHAQPLQPQLSGPPGRPRTPPRPGSMQQSAYALPGPSGQVGTATQYTGTGYSQGPTQGGGPPNHDPFSYQGQPQQYPQYPSTANGNPPYPPQHPTSGMVNTPAPPSINYGGHNDSQSPEPRDPPPHLQAQLPSLQAPHQPPEQYKMGPPVPTQPATAPPPHASAPRPPPTAPQAPPTKPPPPRDLLSAADDDDDNVPSSLSHTATSPTGAPPPLPPSKPPPPSTLHLHSILLPHLQASLPPLLHSLHTTRTHLLERKEDLTTGEPAIRDEMARLEAVRAVCDATGRKMDDVVRRGQERVVELEGRGEVGVDEVVCGISIVHNQLIDLVAEDNALEDTIYHITRALDQERIDLDRFLKSIRTLAREQYMKRALIERILQGMGQTQGW